VDVKGLIINHAKSVGRNDLHSYTVGAITGVIKCCFPSDETVELIKGIIETMHEVMDDKSLPWDVEPPEDTEKAPTAMGADAEGHEEISQPKCTIDNSKVEPLVDRVWAEEILANEEVVANA